MPQKTKITCRIITTKYNLEADWVLHLGDGRYALLECKLGSSEIEEGAGHLVELKRLIREHNKEEKQVPIREPVRFYVSARNGEISGDGAEGCADRAHHSVSG